MSQSPNLWGYVRESLQSPVKTAPSLKLRAGLAYVTIGDKSGYIDKEGNTVFPLEYDSATSFYDGKAIIKKDGRWGFLNKEGEIRWK